MRTHLRSALAIAAAAIAAPALAQGSSQPLTVAVAELRTNGLPADQAWLGRSFSDGVVTALSRARSVRVVERENLDQVMGELKLQSSALVDEASAVRIGRLLGAKTFIFGSVAPAGPGQVLVRARVVNVERGEVIGVAEAQGSTSRLLQVQQDVARQIGAELAVGAAMQSGGGMDMSAATFETYKDLDRLAALARGLPVFDLDPSRSRRQGDYQQATTIAERVTRALPRLARGHYYKALFAFHGEDLDRATAAVRVAQQFAPADVDVLMLRAAIAREAGRTEEAMQVLREVTGRTPDDARAWYALGRLAIADDDRVTAFRSFMSALERGPAIREAETNLKMLLAGTEGRTLIASLGGEDAGLAAQARLLRWLWGDGEKATEADAMLATESAPRFYGGHLARGVLWLQRNDPANAESSLREALALRPGNPEVHRNLGVVLYRRGSCGEAASHVSLYRSTATAITDAATLDREAARCRPSSGR